MKKVKSPTYYREAVRHPWNVAFLAAGAGVVWVIDVMTGSPAQLFEALLGLVLGLDLLIVAQLNRSPRFQQAVRSRRNAVQNRALTQQETFNELSRESQRRYMSLRKLQEEIDRNYAQLSAATQPLVAPHRAKIDGLVKSFLTLVYQQERYEEADAIADEVAIRDTITSLQASIEEDREKVRAIKERRITVLNQRLERIKQGREYLEIIDAQTETVEDVVRYIHEQSLTMNNPEEVTFQLDMLLAEMEETRTTVNAIDDIFTDSVSSRINVARASDTVRV